jgi:3-hydroxyacyl-CoA dehydrogenase/enoyl-CoA hydratase/3-hydroxybutyryl-CoA epimerase
MVIQHYPIITINPNDVENIAETINTIAENSQVNGVVIIIDQAEPQQERALAGQDAAYYFNWAETCKQHLRKLETLGRPVVAVLNGVINDKAFEVALACHHRLVIVGAHTQIGFLSVRKGQMPGWGGVVRTVRMVGLQKAMTWLTTGKVFNPKQALADGLVQAFASDREDAIAQARAWLSSNPTAKAVWDANKNYRVPGGGPENPKIAQMLVMAPAMLRKNTANDADVLLAILSAMVEGTQVDFDTACRIESRYYAALMTRVQ